MKNYLTSLTALLLFAVAAKAQSIIRITEAMSSGGTADWIEVTNLGDVAEDITGWKIDDNSFNFATAITLNGVTTINPGESVVFGESGAATFATDFSTFWGISGVQIGTYGGSGIGLSSSGDGAVLFNSGGIEITRVSFGPATAGSSFYWGYLADGSADPSYIGLISSAGTISGQNTIVSANIAANIGSPGTFISPIALTNGCTDNTACNYNALANNNDGSCTYASNWYQDMDNDGFGNNAIVLSDCIQPAGYVANNTDCNDASNSSNPLASEICNNNFDDDCDGLTDEDCPILRITEAMSSGGTVDWIEITNMGNADADITGFKIDDGSFSFLTSLALNGITTIAAGESVVFGESAVVTFPSDFSTFWGISGTQVGSYSGSGIGLSSSGDGVILFTSTGVEVTRVSFGAATAGSSFYWGYNADGTFDTANVGPLNVGLVSSVGTIGGQITFVSANAAANIGSPGLAISTTLISGCTDVLACNYNAVAAFNDGSCTYETKWYQDLDGDTFGNATVTLLACETPDGYVADNTDCDDTSAAISGGAAEICYNMIDDDCDGLVDEDCPLGNVSIAAASNFLVVNENGASVNVPVTMANATPFESMVTFSLSVYSDATENSDYTWSNSLEIPANTNGIFNLPLSIIDDNISEKAERIVLKIESATNATVSSTNNYSIVFISDNDAVAPVGTNELNLNLLSSFSNGPTGTNSAEIVTYDKDSKRLFIANSIAGKLDIVDFANPSSPVLLSSIAMAPYGNINSVAAHNGILALAIENADPQANGSIVFMDIDGNFVNSVPAGAMPDMITFSKDYTKVLTANEGEPNSTYSSDPEGSVTIVDISGGIAGLTAAHATQISLTGFNGQEAALRAQGIRIFSTSASVAQDLEPEYIAISDDNTKAYVGLQENNAMLVIDLTTNTIDAIRPLGLSNYGAGSNNALDASDQSGAILITGNLPIKGVYMPDAMSYSTVGGNGYVFTANEGDSREFGSVVDANRISSSTFANLDQTAFPDQHILKNNKFLGRLNALKYSGDTDGDTDYDELHVMSGRSFSIWDAATGALVFDSKDILEQITSTSPQTAAFFNASNTTGAATLKNRSDDKGPEVEGITTAYIDGKPYVFVSLERVGGVMIFNVENPASPVYVGYQNNRTLSGSGPDLGAEGIIHISAADSPNGKEIVILANEVSSTLSIFEVNSCATLTNVSVTAENSLICVGETSLLTATSDAPATYQWYNGETAIDGATSSTYTATAIGQYSVSYTNSLLNCGGRSESVGIGLYSSSIVITQQPIKTTVCADETEDSFFVATQNPVKMYQWQMKNSPLVPNWTNLTDDENYSGTATSELKVYNLSEECNNRVFRCRLTNCGSTVNSTNGKLIIAEPVEIEEQPETQFVCLGEDAYFNVEATGSGPNVNNALKYRWQKYDGQSFIDLSNGSLYGGTQTSTLRVKNVNAADAAVTYRCRVTGYCSPDGLNTELASIIVDGSTPGMQEAAEKSVVISEVLNPDFILMPNPATGSSVEVRMLDMEGQAEIIILDATGKLITREIIQNLENEIYTIDLSRIENGMYFIQVITNDRRVVKQLVVNK